MKNAKISRRSFLLGLAACSAAGVLTACKGTDAPSGSTASSAAEPPASSAASSTVQQPEPFLTEAEFPPLDGSTACIAKRSIRVRNAIVAIMNARWRLPSRIVPARP